MQCSVSTLAVAPVPPGSWLARLGCATLLACVGWNTAQAADVGVSVVVSQPGVYGRVDIGRFPEPVVIQPRPVVIQTPAPQVVVAPQPVYMWVPPGHRKNWRKHCHRYRACGAPVYFVRDDWYHQHVSPQAPGYAPGRSDRHGHDDGHGHGRGRGHDDGERGGDHRGRGH